MSNEKRKLQEQVRRRRARQASQVVFNHKKSPNLLQENSQSKQQAQTKAKQKTSVPSAIAQKSV